MMDFVSWDDDIPNKYGKIVQMFPNHVTSYLQKLRVDVIGVGTIIPEMLALDTQPFRSTDFPGQHSSTTKTNVMICHRYSLVNIQKAT